MHPKDRSGYTHTIVGWYAFIRPDFPEPFWGYLTVNPDGSFTGHIYDGNDDQALLSGNVDFSKGIMNFTKIYVKETLLGYEQILEAGNIEYALRRLPCNKMWSGTYNNSVAQRECGCLIMPPLVFPFETKKVVDLEYAAQCALGDLDIEELKALATTIKKIDSEPGN